MTTIDTVTTIELGAGDPVRPQRPEGTASPEWTETEWRAFASSTGTLFGGSWEGEPGELLLDPYPYDEICVMVSGRVALTDLRGGRKEFGAGEVFHVPKGFRGTWTTLEPSKKFFFATAH
ncbi:cupin domain-containing protein [Streptomyces sp. NPDC127190]|uniref:cupin domain-containing protein n=1 Tax=unclassified Streptomyces TaxID=2593676 RepID=UPI00362F2421